MRGDLFFLVLFILYCLEAGLFLVLAPWNAGWDRLAYRIPIELLRELLLWPVFRGAISGFGLLHLVWGFHDLTWLMSRQRRMRRQLEAKPAAAAERPPAPELSASAQQTPPRLRDAG